MEWREFFPRNEFRKYQASTIEMILKAFDSGKKYVIVEGPTGCGKSILAITVGCAFGSTYLATPQKMLQDQYSGDFPDLLCELKGRGTYPCLRTNFNRKKKKKGEDYSPVELRSGIDYIVARDPLNLTNDERSLVQYNCVNAPCNRGSKKKKNDMQKECANFCVYLNQRDKAFSHNLTLMNFSNLLLFTTLMGGNIDWLQPRPLLILDEAHLIEDHLYEFASFVVSTHNMKGLEMHFTSAQDFMRADLPFESVKELCEYVGNHIIPSYDRYALARPKVSDDSDEFDLMTETKSERHRRLRSMYEKLCYFLNPEKETNKPKQEVEDRDVEEVPPSGPMCRPTEKTHVLIPKTRLEGKDDVPSGTQVVPFDVSSLGPSLGFKSSYSKVLLMSATILDVDTYSKSLGIKPEEAMFIRVPSTFPPENRPIIGMPVGYMSYEKIKFTLPKVIEKTVELLEKHSEQKGLIHTGNFVVCRALEKYIKEHGSLELLSRCKFAIAGDAKQKAAIIREHTLSTEPSVLIGPGFLEGLDLKDDLARFQIVMKMPFPSLGNPLVKRKAEEFPAWYQLRTALSFIQLVGRPVRSSTDWAVTYVLDSCWRMFWERAKKIFPDYLHKSISWIKVF